MARGSQPDWPALLRRSTAASYCDMTAAEFEREVNAGRLPMPVKIGDGERWHRVAIDQQLERLCGAAVPDWRAKVKLYDQG